MTIVIRRPVGVFVGLAATAALLTACGSGPSQVGTALIVGNASVSVDQIQQELDNVLDTQPSVKQAQQQGTLDETTRTLVTAHVLHELVTPVAAAARVTVSDAQLDQFVSQSGGLAKLATQIHVDQANARSTVKDVLLAALIGRKYADTMTLRIGVIQTIGRQDAIAKARQLAADPGSLGAMVNAQNALGQSTGQSIGGNTDLPYTIPDFLQTVASAQQQASSSGQTAPVVNGGPLFGAPANTVVAFDYVPSANIWLVAMIKSRNVNGPSTGKASIADSSNLDTLQSIGNGLLEQEAAKLGVRISPRYGTWDPVDMQVVGTNSQTVGVDIPIRSATQP